jgi:hypothetical protein
LRPTDHIDRKLAERLSIDELLQHAFVDAGEHDESRELRVLEQWAMVNCLATDYALRHNGKTLAEYSEALDSPSDITGGEAGKAVTSAVNEARRRAVGMPTARRLTQSLSPFFVFFYRCPGYSSI